MEDFILWSVSQYGVSVMSSVLVPKVLSFVFPCVTTGVVLSQTKNVPRTLRQPGVRGDPRGHLVVVFRGCPVVPTLFRLPKGM